VALVYSTNFLRQPAFSGGPTIFYTVPPGFRAVVKCLTITYGNLDISGFDGWFQDENLCKLARYAWFTGISTPINNGGTQLWFGDWVLDVGETLAIQTVSGTGDFTAAGYELALP